MDQNALIEKITAEVLVALGVAGGSAPARSGCCGSHAAHGPSHQCGSHPASAAPPTGRVLLIFSSTPDNLRTFLSSHPEVAPSRATLALSRDSEVRRSQAEEMGFARVVYMDEGQRPVELVAEHDRVVVCVHGYQQLGNIAGLCDSCWDVRLVLKALSEGRKVVLMAGALDASTPFHQKVESYLKDVASYGIEVVATGGMAAPRGGGSVPRSMSPAGAPPPGRAASPRNEPSVPHAHESGACQLKAGGECGGLGHCSRHLPERVGIIVQNGADRVSAAPGVGPMGSDLAGVIDHTLLRPDATREQVLELCADARQYRFASVCVNPAFVHLAADALRGSDVKVCTVVGFPLGANTTVTKAMETRDAVANGASEIDMVINVGALKAHNDDLVRRDIEAVVEASDARIVKVILETALLDDEEKVRACKIAREAGADFVKTSTGFGPGGATAHDIALMRQTVGRYMGVKASGGIRDLGVAQEMMAAGATRIGASASVKIVKGEHASGTGKQAY